MIVNDFQWYSLVLQRSYCFFYEFQWLSCVIQWFLQCFIDFNDFPLFFNCFHWFSNYTHLLFNAYYFEMIFNEFLDFQWFSYVLHRFPNPFKLLLVSIMIFNVFCFLHRFIMILICFSLFFQFTTSIWYRRRSAGLFVLPHVSFPTFNDMRAWHDMPSCH